MQKTLIISLLLLAAVVGAPKKVTVIYTHERNPLAAIHIIMPGLRSQEKIAGVTALTLDLLDHGTTQHTRLELAKQAEALGAQYSFSCSADHGIISLICPAEYLPQAIDFLQELLTQAVIPEEAFYKLKKEHLVTLEDSETNPFIAGMNANRQLQYNGHYYQTGVLGTIDSVSRINRNDCLETLKNIQHPGKMIIAINGGYPRLATRKSMAALLAALPTGEAPVSQPLPGKPNGTYQLRLPMHTETGLILANIAAPAIGKQYALYRCLEAYIGRGLSSPLFIRARDLNGIGYKVGAVYDARQYDGLFTFFVQTKQKNKTQLAKKLFDLPALTTFDAEQAKRAREYILTTDLKGEESTETRGYKLAWNVLYGLPSNYSLPIAVKQISDEQLKQALTKLQIQNTVIID